jgi:polysaccharide export outer membrane protein
MRVLKLASIQRALAVTAVIVAAGCPPRSPNYDYSREPDPRKQEIVLGPGDVVGINVWENANLNTEAAIRPDGTITMPLVGDIRAAGETPTTLKTRIKAQLSNYVKMQGTEITVAVRSLKSYRFTVQGEVSHPGVFSPDSFLTVSDALAMAGGLTRFARRGDIKLTRRNPKTGELRYIPLDYEALASGKRPEMNIIVLAGDAIWVP